MIQIKITTETKSGAENLYKAVEARINKWGFYDTAALNQWVGEQTDFQYSLKDIVTATPPTLKIITKLLNAKGTKNIPKCDYKMEIRNKKQGQKKIKGYPTLELYERYLSKSGQNIGVGSVSYTSLQLVSDSDITVCPYCNRQYVNNGSKKRSSQLDHFYPKKTYPLLAISFYNLIPSCPNCNHTKSTKEFHESPYDIKDVDSFINFSYKLRTEYLLDIDDITIEVNEDGSGKDGKQSDILDLESHYKLHRDYVQEILRKALVYDKSYLQRLKSDFKNFPVDDNLRTIWGNYFRKDELGKRPLAKLTRDVMQVVKPELIEEIDKTMGRNL